MADNRTYRLECCDLELSLRIALGEHKKARGFLANDKEFILFWAESDKANAFPAPLGVEELLPLVKAWLKDAADYGPQEDIDGHCGRSWTVETGYWGHVEEYGWQSICKITPTWALYGK